MLRGVKGLIYPTRFSAKTGLGLAVLSIPRKSSGPTGCPLVCRMSSILMVGGVSTLPIFSFEGSCIRTYTGELGPRVGVICVSTGAKRNMGRLTSCLLRGVRRIGTWSIRRKRGA